MTTTAIITLATPDLYRNPYTAYEQLRRFQKPVYAHDCGAWVLATYEHCLWAFNNPDIRLLFPPVPDLPPLEILQTQADTLIQSAAPQIDFMADFALPLAHQWALGADALSNSLLSVLRHPKQQALLLTNLALLPHMLDELLRYDTPLPFLQAKTLSAITCAGVHIPAGERLLLGLASANHDPAVSANADILNLLRPKQPNNLIFAQQGRLKAVLYTLLLAGLQAAFTQWSSIRLVHPLTPVCYSRNFKRRQLLALPLVTVVTKPINSISYF